MKKFAFAIALAIASLNAAQAQELSSPRKYSFHLGAGVTHGGDRMVKLISDTSDDSSMRAGGQVAVIAGLDYQMTTNFSMQANIGYHLHRKSYDVVTARFTRYPVELLAHYLVSRNWRLGGGARYMSKPKASLGGDEMEFDNVTGGLVEAERLIGKHWSVKIRYVHENYESKTYSGKLDGSHIGVLSSYYF